MNLKTFVAVLLSVLAASMWFALMVGAEFAIGAPQLNLGRDSGVVTDWEQRQLPPVDMLLLRSNQFAEAYNAWVAAANTGVIDIEKAKEVQKRWKKLQECDGWPKAEEKKRRRWLW